MQSVLGIIIALILGYFADNFGANYAFGDVVLLPFGFLRSTRDIE